MQYLWTILLILGGLLIGGCQSDPILHIGISQCSDDEWRRQMNTEMLREARLHENIRVTLRCCHDDSQQQIKDIQELVSSGIDALIVAPNTSAQLTPIVSEVYDLGIPVVVTDRKIDSDRYSCWVGADNYDTAFRLGRHVVEIVGTKRPVRVLEITGIRGNSATAERSAGFSKAISQFPNLRIVAKVEGEYFAQTAEEMTDSLLCAGIEFDLIFAHCDRMADGAYRAASRHGVADRILFFGMDALNVPGGGIDMLVDNKLMATAIYPTGGFVAMQAAIDLLSEKKTARDIWLESPIVTKQDIPIMLAQRTYFNNLDSQISRLDKYSASLLGRSRLQRIAILLGVALLGVFAIFIILLKKNSRQKQQINLQLLDRNRQIEDQKNEAIRLSEQLQETTQAKLLFFTNISHELRTPLTLITDPAKRLLNHADNLTSEQHEMLETISRNSSTLLRLVNQLLDFRKYENGKLSLTLTQLGLYDAILNWNRGFQLSFHKHAIRFECTCDIEDTVLTCDAEKIERVYFNLMSNAIKFTPDGGTIGVHISGDLDHVCFDVTDSGCGIREEDLPHIFERFYQSVVPQQFSGTGIGLALVKSYVAMHNGTIEVNSKEGAGAHFMVRLPRNLGMQQVEDTQKEQASKRIKDDSQIMLVVEDNEEIRKYIRSLFSSSYEILEAENGKEALFIASSYIPDIIISDVMMPIMDGIEFCKRIKTQIQTSHIPILLLTACALDEQRITGYESGADAYVSKPFNSEVLQAQVRSLVENCRLRKERWSQQSTLRMEHTPMSVDDTFLARFQKLLECNFADSEYSIEMLSHDIGLSRMQLYRKVRQITGFTPNDLLRKIRLEEARRLLLESDISIKEVGYACGFSSSSYFIKCYREIFHITPSETRKNRTINDKS